MVGSTMTMREADRGGRQHSENMLIMTVSAVVPLVMEAVCIPVASRRTPAYQIVTLTLTLTLMIQDSGPSNHRTMFRFSKLKLIGLGGMGMVPIRSFVTKTGIGLGGAKQIVNVTI